MYLSHYGAVPELEPCDESAGDYPGLLACGGVDYEVVRTSVSKHLEGGSYDEGDDARPEPEGREHSYGCRGAGDLLVAVHCSGCEGGVPELVVHCNYLALCTGDLNSEIVHEVTLFSRTSIKLHCNVLLRFI